MVVGFVLITADSHSRNKVNDELRKIPEIKELHPLLGEYDFFAKVEVIGKNEFQSIGEIVVREIRTIDGVIETRTLTGGKISRRL